MYLHKDEGICYNYVQLIEPLKRTQSIPNKLTFTLAFLEILRLHK